MMKSDTRSCGLIRKSSCCTFLPLHFPGLSQIHRLKKKFRSVYFKCQEKQRKNLLRRRAPPSGSKDHEEEDEFAFQQGKKLNTKFGQLHHQISNLTKHGSEVNERLGIHFRLRSIFTFSGDITFDWELDKRARFD